MKRVLAVALLIMSFVAVAFGDGPDFPPRAPKTRATVLLADGPDFPPAGMPSIRQ